MYQRSRVAVGETRGERVVVDTAYIPIPQSSLQYKGDLDSAGKKRHFWIAVNHESTSHDAIHDSVALCKVLLYPPE
ncbi:hypothetical protein chiPu_0025290, partial [Chiloscyllium punctatum]|nr:hypothetical protein [Chiloscyllium punctatum]